MTDAGPKEPFLIGVNLPTSLAECPDPVAYAHTAERAAFDFVSASDHPCGTNPVFETWTMLSWIAAATSCIKVATRVLGVPYRSPAIVAKMAETLDRLSRGRLILGLGGGSADDELHAFGLDVPSAAEKVEGLEDAVRIIRGLWSEAAFTYEGRHHRTIAADLEPKPAQNIPIWLGTFGKRSLAVTGRLADGWIPSLSYAPPEEIPAMRDRVSAAAEKAGRDPSDIRFVYNVEVCVAGTGGLGGHVITGSIDAVVERLRGLVTQLGLGGINLMPIGGDLYDQVERLGAAVLPGLREAVS
jgi:alkanesulfonate monooxygenase SsuD/methylene tetrahydromethanopterin reductase-like flavin-dependent oxidoreductase (luciferase family)